MADRTSHATDVLVTRIGARGDGVADTAGGPVHIPFALPGETWRLVEGTPPVALPGATDRNPPICRHFGTCGGCAAQHLPEDVYRRWKTDLVETAFRHRGLSPDVGAVRTIEAGARRRASFSLARTPAGITLGYNERGTNSIVNLCECPVLDPAIVAGLGRLREIADLVMADGPPAICRVTVTRTETGLDVAFEDGSASLSAAKIAGLARLSERSDVARISVRGETIVQLRLPVVKVAGVDVRIPPGAFLQAVPGAEIVIAELVTAATKRAKRVADLFCGLGTITFPLARRARVLAVDGDAALVSALDLAKRQAPGLKPIETRVRDLFREPLSRLELEPFDAVVFDPPRAGAGAQAEQLARSRVPTVVAVSCNPATLARDARTLVDGGYRIEAVTPVDQFQYSAQIEAIAVFRYAG